MVGHGRVSSLPRPEIDNRDTQSKACHPHAFSAGSHGVSKPSGADAPWFLRKKPLQPGSANFSFLPASFLSNKTLQLLVKLGYDDIGKPLAFQQTQPFIVV